jgi:hypothetical protein
VQEAQDAHMRVRQATSSAVTETPEALRREFDELKTKLPSTASLSVVANSAQVGFIIFLQSLDKSRLGDNADSWVPLCSLQLHCTVQFDACLAEAASSTWTRTQRICCRLQ